MKSFPPFPSGPPLEAGSLPCDLTFTKEVRECPHCKHHYEVRVISMGEVEGPKACLHCSREIKTPPTKDEIEQQSKLIEACRMIGATFKGDKIEFASGLVAIVTLHDRGWKLDPEIGPFPWSTPWYISYTRTTREIYLALVRFLAESDVTEQ